MSASIPRRIAAIKKLAKEYYCKPKGALIAKYDEKLRVFDIRGSKHHNNHPHRMSRVYLSRLALKHFVESRAEELLKNHDKDEVFEKICFAIDRIQEVITNFDKYEYEPPKHFYTKDYSHQGEPQIRVLLELKKDRLEIVSIHFKRRA